MNKFMEFLFFLKQSKNWVSVSDFLRFLARQKICQNERVENRKTTLDFFAMDSTSKSGGFSFSQDISQRSSQSSGFEEASWISSSQSQPQPFSYPQSITGSQSQPFEDRPFSSVNPMNFPIKKAKYNLPKWSKAIMKTADDAQKQKDLEMAVKTLEEENRQMRAVLQEQHRTIMSYPAMLKESTDYVVTNLKNCVEKFHLESLEKFNQKNQELKIQNENQLSEVLAAISAMKESLLAKPNQETCDLAPIIASLDELKNLVSTKVENCGNLVQASVVAKLMPVMSTLDELKEMVSKKIETPEKTIVWPDSSEDENELKNYNPEKEVEPKTPSFNPNPLFCSTPYVYANGVEYLDASIMKSLGRQRRKRRALLDISDCEE